MEIKRINGYNIKDEVARNEIENLTNDVGILTNKKYIFIGDSYLEGYSPEGTVENWGVKVVNILGLQPNQYQIVAYGGSGFTRADTKLFNQMVSELTDDETVTDIVVCGGYNDKGCNEDDLLSRMRTFKETCTRKFPNAKISLGHIGWTKNCGDIYHLHANISKYKKCASKLGLKYLTNVEYSLKKYFSDFSSDNVHPNNNGETSIAEAVASAIVSGQANIQLPFINIGFTLNEEWVLNSNGNIGCSVNNNITSLFVQGVINIRTPFMTISGNDVAIELATITDGYIIGTNSVTVSTSVNCVIGYSGGFATMPGRLIIDGGKLLLSLYNTNTYTGGNNFGGLEGCYLIQIQASSVSIDSTLC